VIAANTGVAIVPLPIDCIGVSVNVANVALVPYRNHAWVVLPFALTAALSLAADAVTLLAASVATSGVCTTVTLALPNPSPLVAEMLATPAPVAVTTPELLTTAAAALLVDQVMWRGVEITAAPESLSVGVNVRVSSRWSVTVTGATST
jgi:hypothetical protein